MQLTYSDKKKELLIKCQGMTHRVGADCNVRNELNGLRRLADDTQVIFAMTGNRYDAIPYMPRQFPAGTWKLGMPVEKSPEDKYLWPWYIPTNAWQLVTVWELRAGGYFRKTSVQVQDFGYGIHYSESVTTLGCIRVAVEEDIQTLAYMVQSEIRLGKPCTLIVEEYK
jgi:hypothetical protein